MLLFFSISALNRTCHIATKESPNSDTSTIFHGENTSTTNMSLPSQCQQCCLNKEGVNTASPAANMNNSEESKVLCSRSSKYSAVRLLAKYINNYIQDYKYQNIRKQYNCDFLYL